MAVPCLAGGVAHGPHLGVTLSPFPSSAWPGSRGCPLGPVTVRQHGFKALGLYARMISLWGEAQNFQVRRAGLGPPTRQPRAWPSSRTPNSNTGRVGERYPLSFRLRLRNSVLRGERGHLLGKTAATEAVEGGCVSNPASSGDALDACAAGKHPPAPRPRGIGMIASWGGRRTGWEGRRPRWVGHLASGELFLTDGKRPVFNAG